MDGTGARGVEMPVSGCRVHWVSHALGGVCTGCCVHWVLYAVGTEWHWVPWALVPSTHYEVWPSHKVAHVAEELLVGFEIPLRHQTRVSEPTGEHRVFVNGTVLYPALASPNCNAPTHRTSPNRNIARVSRQGWFCFLVAFLTGASSESGMNR